VLLSWEAGLSEVLEASVEVLPTSGGVNVSEPSPDSAPLVSFELPPHATSASTIAMEETRATMRPGRCMALSYHVRRVSSRTPGQGTNDAIRCLPKRISNAQRVLHPRRRTRWSILALRFTRLRAALRTHIAPSPRFYVAVDRGDAIDGRPAPPRRRARTFAVAV
jgi:hypothetical protein